MMSETKNHVESDRLESPLLHYGILAIIYLLGLMTLFYHGVHHALAAHSSTRATCAVSEIRQINLTGHGFEPAELSVKPCTKLLFVNLDKVIHDPAFGEHNHHDYGQQYSERSLGYQEQNSAILPSPGSYIFHDHFTPSMKGHVQVVE